jgi:hypothetical protein
MRNRHRPSIFAIGALGLMLPTTAAWAQEREQRFIACTAESREARRQTTSDPWPVGSTWHYRFSEQSVDRWASRANQFVSQCNTTIRLSNSVLTRECTVSPRSILIITSDREEGSSTTERLDINRESGAFLFEDEFYSVQLPEYNGVNVVVRGTCEPTTDPSLPSRPTRF